MIGARTAVTSVALVGAVVFLGAAQAGIIGLPGRGTGGLQPARSPSYQPWPQRAPANAKVDLGVTTLPLARNSWRAWRQADLGSVNEFEHAIHKHVSVVMWYADWSHPEPLLRQLEAVSRRGSIPEITWEPWDALHAVRHQPRFRLREIASGRFDAMIRVWAKSLAAYRKPVRLRLAQEMNGSWYPWSEVANGNRPGEFVRAWRHVHDVFTAAHATNVRWIWSPAAIAIPRELYPGSKYVDAVSLSLFNGGSQLHYSSWRPFASLAGPALARLHTLAPDKPVELSEIGCATRGGNKTAWIAGMFRTLRRYPAVHSVIWYDLTKWSDWGILPGSKAARAYAAAVAGQRYR